MIFRWTKTEVNCKWSQMHLPKLNNLLNILEEASSSNGLYINTNKTVSMCFKLEVISPLSGQSLKFVDQFIYRGFNISSTESYVNICLSKAWTAIDKYSIIWKSALLDKMKQCFFQVVTMSVLHYGCTSWMLTKNMEKKQDCNDARILWVVLMKSWKQYPIKCINNTGFLSLSRFFCGRLAFVSSGDQW